MTENIYKKRSIPGFLLGGAFLLFFLLSGCSKSVPEDQLPDDYLAAYGSDVITLRDVFKTLPGGVSADDSVRFVRAAVTSWIQSHLISERAAELIDMDEINRLTQDYRNSLILSQYRRLMYAHNADAFPEDTIKKYYDSHKTEFVLERPLVKGTYLKVPDDARNLRTLKTLYRSDRAEDADRLEKEVLSSAIHYDYFKDRWVDWEQIESKIPENFGNSPDSWLARHKFLEKSVGGFTYLLYIVDVLPSGSPMPIEAARSQIVNRLLNINRAEYDAALLNDLYQQALDDKKLKINNQMIN